jgi:sensor histidine kinase YesM
MDETLHRQTVDANWILQLLIAKKHRVYRHLTLIVFSVTALYYSPPEYTEPVETYSRLVTLSQILLLAYSNMYYFVPKFLFRSRYVTYCIFVFAGMVASSAIHRLSAYSFSDYLLPNEQDTVNFFIFSFMSLILIVASAAIKLFQQWVENMQRINHLEQANIKAELEQLKNQINPHFLFNMLNNANVLTKKDPDKASEVLVKLSDLLRYQLYDSSREKVLLTSDIHFLHDFLNLEKVRRDNFDFMISKEGNLNSILIPPLLFISFVENAVKHNNDSARSSYVNLYFNVQNNELYFRCINSKPAIKAVRKAGGLGLANIKRRLELLYPDAHELVIDDRDDTYSITLTIRL